MMPGRTIGAFVLQLKKMFEAFAQYMIIIKD